MKFYYTIKTSHYDDMVGWEYAYLDTEGLWVETPIIFSSIESAVNAKQVSEVPKDWNASSIIAVTLEEEPLR